MFCSKCGKQMEDADKFCPQCGEPQYGDPRPDSEFKKWLRQRRMLWVVIGAVLVALGIFIRRPQLVMIGAIMSTASLLSLTKLDK